jgi:hypothetical protein
VAAPPGVSVAEWAWQRQSIWSQTADALKATPARARRWRLALIIMGAGLALAGTQLKPVKHLAGVGVGVGLAATVVMAGTALLRGRETLGQVRDWTRARSVSEAIKTEVFLYLTHTGIYAGADRDKRLDAEVQRLEGPAADLKRFTQGVKAKVRELPAVNDVETYLELRVRKSQIAGYYEPKSIALRQRLRDIKRVEVFLALAAAVLSAVTAFSPNTGAWAAVVTTAAGALAAHVAAERYEFLWIEYSRTASELQRLADRRTAADGSALSDADLIAACENVISVQNQAWMAKWGTEEPAK